ncbi:MAG TPA: hypothetical protein VK752_06150 [Bryobacteraceae bacterium]|nr:hypothetical protein [Bryobacteraceae bacterium]
MGGNRGDYFILGPGRNTIVGGSGNDTIYAHPSAAGLKNILDLQFAATNLNATTPSISVKINGRIAVAATPITAVYNTSTQDFQIDVRPYQPISAVEIDVTGTSYTDQNNYSNVEIMDMTYKGAPISLGSASYSSGGSNPGFTYSNNGTVVFPPSAFLVASNFLEDTSDTIDGGAGNNTVVYWAASKNYTMLTNADGSVTVIGNVTAEGPDVLRNIQTLRFTDKTVTLK